jgi:hypothetical protein
MHVQITDVTVAEDPNPVIVEFSTPFGVGVGEWRGEMTPERYSHHYVEIETANRLTWGQDIKPVSAEHFIIDCDLNSLVTLQGKVESVEPDGITYLLIGATLVTVKTHGQPLAQDSFVRAQAEKLILFPYEE